MPAKRAKEIELREVLAVFDKRDKLAGRFVQKELKQHRNCVVSLSD